MAVGIGEEGEGRGEEGNGRFRCGFRRQHEEGQEVLSVASTGDVCCVDAAGEVRREGPAETGLPFHVVKIVAMEMDGAVEIRVVAPTQRLALPIVAGDGARG